MSSRILDILANPGVGNFLLLMAALVGVVGSYFLYQKRLNDRRTAARKAIKSELESMTGFDRWVEENWDELSEGVPVHSLVSSSAYEGHREDIGLLTDEEIDVLTGFYSRASTLEDKIDYNKKVSLQTSMTKDAVDKGRKEREAVVRDEIDQLIIERWKAIQILKKNLNDEHDNVEKFDIPQKAGGKVSSKHPLFQNEKLVSEGYFEKVPDEDMYKMTEKGENWIDQRVSDNVGL